MALMKSLLSLHNTLPTGDATVPEWIQVLPVGQFFGDDGRGPFVVNNAQQIIDASFNNRTKLPIDENHSTDVALKGEPTPARGWIVAMQAREDGIWARVEWTEEGKQLVGSRAYGFISPAIMHSDTKPYAVGRILRASLVNDPNFNMKSLHKKEIQMEAELIKLLGLDEKADKKSIMSTLRDKLNGGAASIKTVTAAAKALGLEDGADGEAVITSLNSRLAENQPAGDEGDKDQTIAALNDQVKSLNNTVSDLSKQLTGEVQTNAKARAERVIGKALDDLKIVPTLKDHYISRHMKNPKEVEDELKLMPSLHQGGIKDAPNIDTEEGQIAGADAEVCSLMGLDPEAFAKQAKVTGKEFS